MSTMGISQKAVILNAEGKFLVLHRSSTAPSKPNQWDLPGGELDYGEDPSVGILREIKEETGLEVDDLAPFDVEAHINQADKFWITICYKCRAHSYEVKLSFEHDDSHWTTERDFFQLEASKKIRRFVTNLKKH
jgi:8-oxo-dGTP diphosphatase